MDTPAQVSLEYDFFEYIIKSHFVGAVRGCRESKQQARREVVYDLAVCACRSVMTVVYQNAVYKVVVVPLNFEIVDKTIWTQSPKCSVTCRLQNLNTVHPCLSNKAAFWQTVQVYDIIILR